MTPPVIAPTKDRPAVKVRRRWTRRLLGALLGVLAIGGIVGANVPTVGALAAGWYHRYQVTRPAYEAKYGLWVKLNIPSQYRINAVHSTVLYNGNVLIMAGSGNNQDVFNAGKFKTLLFNPVTMKMRVIYTPSDVFCSGHVELPDGNILIAGGTLRYENLKPVYPAGSMTVVNNDPYQAETLPKGTVFVAPDGARFATAYATTVPAATRRAAAKGEVLTVSAEQNVWVDATARGKVSLIGRPEHYSVQGQADSALYGIGTPMTLQKQNFFGTKDAYIFDVKTSRFARVDSMNYARWYPTLAEMGNGMVMAMSGLNDQGQVTMNSEMFNPSTGRWTQGPSRGFPTYPSTFLTASGQLFFTGSNTGFGPASAAWRTPGFWNVRTNTFTPVPGIPSPGDLETSASVLLPPAQNGKIMVLGGGGVGQSASSTARTALIDMDAADPKWIPGPNLAQPTRYPVTVLLPTDQVLVTGGSRYYRGMHGSDNRDTRVYDVATNSFSWAANSLTGRDYHSEGLLLPNGSVLTLGGNPLYGDARDTEPQTFNQEVDIYYPPYLFQGTRPSIISAPKIMAPGQKYLVKVSQAANVKYLRLMRPDNATHVTDVNARSIGISFTS
ncbi:MAG TPA: galactose oxidase, partial [Trebonia sp.]